MIARTLKNSVVGMGRWLQLGKGIHNITDEQLRLTDKCRAVGEGDQAILSKLNGKGKMLRLGVKGGGDLSLKRRRLRRLHL